MKGWIILVTSIILVIALIDNSLLIGQAFNSTKILPPNNSEDLTSQDRVLIKLTPSGTSAQGDVYPKNIKVKVGTTVVWQNMLPEKVYVQSKPDENHYEGDYKNVLKSVIFTNVELTVTDPKITQKPSFLSNARIEDSPIIPSTLNETLIDPKPTNATIKLNSTENKAAEDLALQTTLDNNTEDLALQTTLDNNAEDLALQTTLDNNTEDLALQTTLDNNTEDLALQTTLDNNTEDLALQTTLDNNTEDLALQTTLDNNTEDLALQTTLDNNTENSDN